MNYDNDIFGGFNEVEDMPSLEEFEALAQEEQTPAEETPAVQEDTKPAEQEKKPAKPNPYEEVILAEMKRRAQTDAQIAQGLASPDKSISECFQYVTKQARKQATGNCAMVADAVVYGWAVHYYTESKAEIDKELKPAPKAKATTKQEAKKAPAKKPAFSPTLTAKKSSHDPADSDKMKKMQKLLQLSLFN